MNRWQLLMALWVLLFVVTIAALRLVLLTTSSSDTPAIVNSRSAPQLGPRDDSVGTAPSPQERDKTLGTPGAFEITLTGFLSGVALAFWAPMGFMMAVKRRQAAAGK